MDFPSVAFAGMSFFFFATQFIEQIEKKRKRNLFLNFKTKSQKGLSQNCFSLRIIFDIKKKSWRRSKIKEVYFRKTPTMKIRKPKKRENLFLKLETKYHEKLGKCESKNFVLRVLECGRDEIDEFKHPCIQKEMKFNLVNSPTMAICLKSRGLCQNSIKTFAQSIFQKVGSS